MLKRSLCAAVLAVLAPAAAMAQPPSSASIVMPPIVVGDPGPDGVRIDRDGVFANFFPSKAPGRSPAVLFLGGSEGGLYPGGGGMVKGLTGAGFNVLYLCYFGCPNTSAQLGRVPLETFDRGLAFLRAQPGVDPRRIAIVGGSKGAEAALLVAGRDPSLKAVVAAMPSSVVWAGITPTTAGTSSWSAGGAPLPFLPYAFASFSKGVFFAYNDALSALPQHADAAIPVERITAPILLVCGEADGLWPSCPMADAVAERLKAKGRPAPMILRYKDAGHAVFGSPVDKTNPNYAQLGSLGGSADGNAAARADDWPKAVAFLKAKMAN